MYLHDRIGVHAIRGGGFDPDFHDHVTVLGLGRKHYRVDRANTHARQCHRRAGLQTFDALEMRLQNFGVGEELRAMTNRQDREAQDRQPGCD